MMGDQSIRKVWESTAVEKVAGFAPDPKDNDIDIWRLYGGYLTRENHRTGTSRSVNVYPNNPMGHGAEDIEIPLSVEFPYFSLRIIPICLYDQ